MSDLERLHDLANRTAREIEFTKQSLIDKARWLARDLTETADRIETDPDYVHNSLGIVQGKGLDVDRFCAVLSQQRATLKILTSLLKATTDQGQDGGGGGLGTGTGFGFLARLLCALFHEGRFLAGAAQATAEAGCAIGIRGRCAAAVEGRAIQQLVIAPALVGILEQVIGAADFGEGPLAARLGILGVDTAVLVEVVEDLVHLGHGGGRGDGAAHVATQVRIGEKVVAAVLQGGAGLAGVLGRASSLSGNIARGAAAGAAAGAAYGSGNEVGGLEARAAGAIPGALVGGAVGAAPGLIVGAR